MDHDLQFPRDYPRILTLAGARVYLRQLQGMDGAPCCHGHYGCATYRGGPCADETLSAFPAAEGDDNDE
jgi:hypothetical protein